MADVWTGTNLIVDNAGRQSIHASFLGGVEPATPLYAGAPDVPRIVSEPETERLGVHSCLVAQAGYFFEILETVIVSPFMSPVISTI